MHRIVLRKMHRRHRATRERAMAQKLADAAQIPVAWASGLLAEEHQVTPSPAEPERAGLMQVLNAPEHAGRTPTLNYPIDHLAAATDSRFDCKDLAVAYIAPPIEGMRYLSPGEIERMSKLHIVLAPEMQVLVDEACGKSRDTQPANDASTAEPTVEPESEHRSDAVPNIDEQAHTGLKEAQKTGNDAIPAVISAAEITKAEISVEESDYLEEDEEDEEDVEDEDEEDESEDDEDLSDEELDALERASDPSPQMTSPVAEAVLRAAMKQTQPKKPETQAAPAPVVAVVYPPAPEGAKCATCQEPAVHHVGYHDYCQRCTPTSLKRKAKGK